jgi:hypothetical protein
MPALLSRIFRRRPAGPIAGLIPFGPQYSLAGDRLTIESGPLTGTVLSVERDISDTKADFAFYAVADSDSRPPDRRPPDTAEPVAHCHFDRDPETGTETLWGIFIRSEFRHRRLATPLIRLTLRELLASGRRHWFAIRKLMQVDSEASRRQAVSSGSPKPDSRNPQSSHVSLHNLGLGLIALRLGFRPEPGLDRLLAPGNVKAIQALPPEPPSPPGLLVRLDTLPGLLVAAFLDPDTGRPLADAEAYERFVSPRQLLRHASAGEAIVGNIDYVLPRAAIMPLAVRLANDHTELKRFVAALRRGARD